MRFEPLQTEYYKWRHGVDLNLLICFNMVFTLVTVPRVFLFKFFSLSKEFQATLDVLFPAYFRFLILLSSMMVIAHQHLIKELLRFLHYFVIEHYLELKSPPQPLSFWFCVIITLNVKGGRACVLIIWIIILVRARRSEEIVIVIKLCGVKDSLHKFSKSHSRV